MDLGSSVIDRKTKQINIKDPFLAFQMYEHKRHVNKMGKLGKVNFYYDVKLPDYRIEIYFDTYKYEKEVDTTNLDDWLKTTLFEIEKTIGSPNDNRQQKE